MVKSGIFGKVKFKFGFLTKAQSSILSAAGILAVTSGLSAVLGLAKNRLLTSYFGISPELSVFYTADKVPSLIYALFVVGVLSTVFIPIYAGALKRDKAEADKIASAMINFGSLFFILLGSLVFCFSRQIFNLISAFQYSPAEVDLGVSMMRVILLAQILLLWGSFLTSMAQTHGYFLLSSMAPVVYNLGMILGIVFFNQKCGIQSATWGVLGGAMAYFLMQTPIIKKIDLKYSFSWNINSSPMKKAFSSVPPRFLNVLITSSTGVIYNSLALLVSKSSVIYLKFADQLQSFPVTFFALSIASATLPVLSKNADSLENERFKKIFLTSLHQMLFFVLPCSVILLVLRVPVIRIVYGAAKFPWEGTLVTSYILAFFSLSIFSQSISLLSTRAFYALGDTKTPLKTSLFFAPLNLGLCYVLIAILQWGSWSISLAYSATSILESAVLIFLLGKRLWGFDVKSLLYPFVKMSYASVFMGISLYLPLKILDKFVFDTTRTIQLLATVEVAGALGMGAYLFFTRLFRVEEVWLMTDILRKFGIKKGLKEAPKISIPASPQNFA